MNEKLIGVPDDVVLSKIYLISFPDDFMFQLNESEWAVLKSQFATSSWGGIRKLPFVFTELQEKTDNLDRKIAVGKKSVGSQIVN